MLVVPELDVDLSMTEQSRVRRRVIRVRRGVPVIG